MIRLVCATSSKLQPAGIGCGNFESPLTSPDAARAWRLRERDRGR
jgi:hypothetical protein